MNTQILRLLAIGLLSGPISAQANSVVYSAPLLGSSEVPAVITTGSGTSSVTIDFNLLTMRVQLSFSGLIGNTTAAHIHCCVDPGANVGVASILPSFSGFPLGVKSGSYDFTYDMSLASSYNPAFITSNGGTVGGAFNALVTGLGAGRAYLNVHTQSFPGGEIRGLLQPEPTPTTEPGTLALLSLGLAGLGLSRRRKAA